MCVCVSVCVCVSLSPSVSLFVSPLGFDSRSLAVASHRIPSFGLQTFDGFSRAPKKIHFATI